MEIIGSYSVYNKDSRFLSEIEDKTIDFVITSPPFNISHKYNSYHDSLDYNGFDELCSTVIGSISRVLKDDGFFIIDIADMIVMESIIMYGAEFIKDKALSENLDFICSFPYIAVEEGEIIINSCIPREDVNKRFHSSCEQILVFGKSRTQHYIIDKIHIKSSYSYSNVEDSAFWPKDLVQDILSPFDLNGKILLDPFMGSGTIGRMILKRGGHFIGYDVDRETLKTYKWI